MNERGYAIYDGVFRPTEMTSVLKALARAEMPRTRAGARHVLRVPIVRDLANSVRLMNLAAQYVGPDPVAFRGTFFDKSPESNWLIVWHQDTALPMRDRGDDGEWGPWSMKAGVLYAHAPVWALEKVIALRVHLDDSTAANGPLRVLPQTHRRGVMTDEEIDQAVREIAAVDCVTAAGGIVAMRPLTVHASSKSTDGNPRRVLHIEYAGSVMLRSGIELAVD